jgi:hypothetical protein
LQNTSTETNTDDTNTDDIVSDKSIIDDNSNMIDNNLYDNYSVNEMFNNFAKENGHRKTVNDYDDDGDDDDDDDDDDGKKIRDEDMIKFSKKTTQPKKRGRPPNSKKAKLGTKKAFKCK